MNPAAPPASAAVEPVFAELYDEIADCPRCALARTRSRTVPGTGPSTADIMFIGEAPGAREDELGLPFVGAAGRFLDDLLASIGLSRADVYICNVVKCRPPGNRDPEPEEIGACEPFLDRQIAIVNPRVIVTLGRFSMARWFPGMAISRIHGRAREFDGRTVVPMYHPAAALHRGDLRAVIEADFAQLPQLIHAASEPPRADAVEAAGDVDQRRLI
ncbi:MAG: uracil-DNA glycosylase [Dehalococcoidia bacterium]